MKFKVDYNQSMTKDLYLAFWEEKTSDKIQDKGKTGEAENEPD